MSTLTFPDPNDLFMTSGDGDIQKPYTPIGEIFYTERGWRIPLPLWGLIRFHDVYPEQLVREKLESKVREMGGDSVINLRVDWSPPSSGFLGFLATGGSIVVTGTVIKR